MRNGSHHRKAPSSKAPSCSVKPARLRPAVPPFRAMSLKAFVQARLGYIDTVVDSARGDNEHQLARLSDETAALIQKKQDSGYGLKANEGHQIIELVTNSKLTAGVKDLIVSTITAMEMNPQLSSSSGTARDEYVTHQVISNMQDWWTQADRDQFANTGSRAQNNVSAALRAVKLGLHNITELTAVHIVCSWLAIAEELDELKKCGHRQLLYIAT